MEYYAQIKKKTVEMSNFTIVSHSVTLMTGPPRSVSCVTSVTGTQILGFHNKTFYLLVKLS